MYSSFGYVVLGAIIEKITGVFAEDYIMDNIVKPLGMTDTFFDIPPEKAGRIAIRSEEAKEYLLKLQNGKLRMKNKGLRKKSRLPERVGDCIQPLMIYKSSDSCCLTMGNTKVVIS